MSCEHDLETEECSNPECDDDRCMVYCVNGCGWHEDWCVENG